MERSKAAAENIQKSFMMIYNVLKELCIPKQVMSSINTTVSKQVPSYRAESWSLTKMTSSGLQAAEIKIHQTIRGETRIERLRN